MIVIQEGEKRDVIVRVARASGSDPFVLTVPQRRILTSARAVVSGYDWATASWDADDQELSCLFDSTATGLTAVGTYYVQVRCTIGTERYAKEVRVDVREWGP